MTSTTFTARTGTIPAVWLNDVNTLVWAIFNGISAVPTSGKILRSNGTNIVPSTYTIPDTYTTGDILYASATNTLTALAKSNSALLTTSAGGVPTWSTASSTFPYTLGVGQGGTGLTTFTAKGAIPAASASTTLVALQVGTDGQALVADSSQTAGLVYLDNPSRPNLLINPNWQIDQINEGALYTINASPVQGPDGWSGSVTGAGVFKLRTLADPDNAALKCLEITCTTADVSIAATDCYGIFTAVEGYDAAALMAGTSSAQSITIQFKFKTSVTGVYGVAISNSAQLRRYIGTITVSDTSEHEYSVTLTMDTSGTWLYTNGVGLYFSLTLAAGSNFQSTAGSWAAATSLFGTTASQANFMSSTSNIAYLKRVQLIPGALVQAYRSADIQKELLKIQRYYWKAFSQGTAVATNSGILSGTLVTAVAANNNSTLAVRFPVVMRVTPTIVTYNPLAANANWRDFTAAADRTATAANIGDSGLELQISGAVAPNSNYIFATANARLS